MQILIDTDAATPDELAHLVIMIDGILAGKHKATAIAPSNVREVVAALGTPAIPAPPPPPATMPIGDPDVEVDEAGTVTGVTVSVSAPSPASVSLPPAIPAPPGPAAPPDYDNVGMPYDARIHASNHAKTIAGQWKNKRGLDKTILAAVTAELRPLFRQAAVALATMPTVAPALPTAPPPPPVPLDAGSSVPPVTAPVPPPPPAITPAPVVPPSDFRAFMQKISGLTSGGKLTQVQLGEALATVALKPEELSQLLNNPALIASVNAAIDKIVS